MADGGSRAGDLARGANNDHVMRVACARRAGESGVDASIGAAPGLGQASCGVQDTGRLARRVRPPQADVGRCLLTADMLEDGLRHRVTAVFRFIDGIRLRSTRSLEGKEFFQSAHRCELG